MEQASAEKLEHGGPAEKESGLSARKRAVGKYVKKKRNRAVCPEPDREVEESQDKREPHLGEREGIKAEA